MMAVRVGLPFLVVSTMAPLLQRWYATLPVPSSSDPYFLYAASNLGSMLSLLAYPFVLEPAWGVRLQTLLWSGGYVLLIVLTASCVWMVRKHGALSPIVSESAIRNPRSTLGWEAPRPLDSSGVRAIEPDARRHDAHLDRSRADAAALGASARDLSRHLHPGLRDAADRPGQAHRPGAARSRADRDGVGGDANQRAEADPDPSRGVLLLRDDLSHAARPHPSVHRASDRVLSLDVARRHAGRRLQHARRHVRVQRDL